MDLRIDPSHDASVHDGDDAREHACTRATLGFGGDDDPRVVAWAIALLRLAASICVAVQILEAVHEFISVPGLAQRLVVWRVLTGGLEALIVALSFTSLVRRHWRTTALAVGVVMMAGVAIITTVDGHTERLIVYAFVILLTAGAMVPWEPRWEIAAAAAAFSILAAQAFLSPRPDPDRLYHLVAIVAAALLGYLNSRLGQFYRISLANDEAALRRSGLHLQDALHEGEKVLAERDRTEAGLRSSRTTLRKILDAMLDVVIVTRLSDGAFVDINREFYRLGFTPEDLLQPPTEGAEGGVWAHSEQRKEFRRRIDADGTVRSMEVDFRRTSGTVWPCLLSAVKVEIDGEPCLVSFAQDISTLREATRKLTESENTLRTIFEACPDAISIARVADGRFIDLNPTIVDSSGLNRDALIGQSDDDLQVWNDKAQRLELQRRLSADGQVQNMEVSLRKRDGSTIPALMSAVVVQLRGEQCVVAFTRDITRLKQTESELIAAREELSRQLIALGQSEQTFRKLFSANLDALTISDAATGVCIDANDEFLRWTGFTREKVVGRELRSLNAWVNREEVALYSEQIQRDGEVRNLEMAIRLKDGTVVPTLVSAVRLDVEGRSCWLSNMRSITELKSTQNELVATREAALAASRAKSEFLSSMSHEIRTPMNTILGMADLLAEGELGEEPRRYLNMIISNGNMLLKLINSILDLARIESGRMIMESIDFDPREVTEEALATVAICAHEKGLDLVTKFDPSIPTRVVGDPLRLNQILINLVGNAIKFTSSGQVTVSIEPVADAGDASVLKFAVKDSGIGISRDKLALLFDAFTQADSSTSRKYGGSGLGLAIVKRLVDLMNGKIAVESEEGKGSIFSFTATFETASATAGPAPRDEPQLTGVEILVAAANPVTSSGVADLLSRRGARTTEVSTGPDAIGSIKRARSLAAPFQIAIVEAAMPEVDGFEVARQLIESPGNRGQVVMMFTAHDLTDNIARLKSIGLVNYVLKPVKRADLMAAVANALEQSRATIAAQAHAVAAAEPPPYSTLVVDRPLGILLVDDSRDNRFLIQAYLKNTPYRVEEAADGQEAVDRFIAGTSTWS